MSDRESADLANQLKAIIDTVVDGIITIDSRGAIRSFNPAAERIVGYRSYQIGSPHRLRESRPTAVPQN